MKMDGERLHVDEDAVIIDVDVEVTVEVDIC